MIPLTDVKIFFHVSDFLPAKKFYKILGFKKVWEQKPRLEEGFLVLKRGTSILTFVCGNQQVFKHPYFKNFSKTTPTGYGVETVIHIEDIPIKDFFALISNSIIKTNLVDPLKLRPWGKMDFRLIDPYGHYLRISEPDNVLI